ncbi:triosephosphate isomerase [candidate division MSBL1 archaeon SCGC-AAA259J03]|uniref:Triosephosphate isomerase n=1 Tax=candidate division MSBL1 archaeon SCGC-AAA259J03 TaxID=1698269 RepID=A0A656YW06_9EURY|nr:triosephosphate isomerase [candidate division MSBL1 archaeon SCGC-AAA259J03]
MEFPNITVNLKAYPHSLGEKSVKVSEDIAEAGSETGIGVGVSPQYADLYRVTGQVDIPVFAQHVDSLEPGRGTGYLLPEAAEMAGAVGSLVNHSEHQLDLEEIEKIVDRLEEVGLISLVCAEDVETAGKVAAFGPDIVAVEPPELIGTGRSVSQAQPEIIENTVKRVHEVDPDVHVLCGAGVSSGEDVETALELGAEGILIASAVVKADDPKGKMVELAEGALRAEKA